MEQLITKKHLSRQLSISVRMIENLMKRKTIPFIKFPGKGKHGSIRFELGKVLAALDRFTVRAVE